MIGQLLGQFNGEMMKKSLAIALISLTAAYGFSQGSPISLTGFNQDVIANGTDVTAGDAVTSTGTTTATLDSIFVLYNESYFGQYTNYYGQPLYGGVPDNGAITSMYDGTNFQLANYDSNNVLLIFQSNESAQGPSSGTLDLSTPSSYSSLSFLLSGYNGAENGSYTLNFADGSTTTSSFTAPDNFDSSANIAYQVIGRMNRSTGQPEYDGAAPYLDQLNLQLTGADASKTLDSVTFTNLNTSGGGYNTIGVYAISGVQNQAVPLPSAAIPLALGALGLVLKRRRA